MARTHSTLAAGACAALLALAGASAAVAQQNSPAAAFAAAAGQQAQPAQDGHAQWRAMTPEQRQQMRERRAAALKQQLAITPDQENAWASFQQALQPASHAHAPGQRPDWKQLTTPERIDRMRELRAQRMAEQDRRGDATKAFYAALRPEQQRTFDAQAARMMGHRGHGQHGQGRTGQ